jgi:hypothetical protein
VHNSINIGKGRIVTGRGVDKVFDEFNRKIARNLFGRRLGLYKESLALKAVTMCLEESTSSSE